MDILKRIFERSSKMNLIEKNITGNRLGKIKVDDIDYNFTVKKTFTKKMWALIELFEPVTGKHINHIMVPKNISLGAVVDTGENKVCLLMTEIKSLSWFANRRYIPNRWSRK